MDMRNGRKENEAIAIKHGSVGELADPMVSKTIASEGACEFDSRLSYKLG